jgi:hypothetical protein
MHFGNPFGRKHEGGGSTQSRAIPLVILNTTDRQDTITAYREWLLGLNYTNHEPERRLWILKHIGTLIGHKLGCFCAPKTLAWRTHSND